MWPPPTTGTKYMDNCYRKGTNNRVKIINWNIRGAGRKSFYSQVKDLLFKYNPYIIVCIGTRLKTNRVHKVIKKVSLPNFTEIPLVGFSEGI